MGRTIDGSAIDGLLESAVRDGAVPHVAAIVADRDGILYENGFGLEAPDPVEDQDSTTSDWYEDWVPVATQFRIMSMTKMITTTVALQQRDRGRLDFDAPVEKYVPAFANVRVLDGWEGGDPEFRAWDPGTPKLRAPRTRATVRHLVTHTSGLAYAMWNDDIVRYDQYAGTPNVLSGNMSAFDAPMVHDPGTRYTYGINADWLGRVVEAVAGRPLDVVVRDDITGPLGMGCTGFRMNERQRANSVAWHVPSEGGTWADAGDFFPEAPKWWSGGHGLYSTPRDYIRFQRALLRGGELDGRRILRSGTVDEAFTNQIGALDVPHTIPSLDEAFTGPFEPGPGWKWGWGLLLNSVDVPGGRSAGSGAWSGLLGTPFWVDRTTGICASIYTNSLPFNTPEALGLYGDFEQAVYAALR